MQEKYVPGENNARAFNRQGRFDPFKHNVRTESFAKLGSVNNTKELQHLTSQLGLYITSVVFIYRGEIHRLSRHENPTGTFGGFVETTAYAAPGARVDNNALVLDKARVEDQAQVLENAILTGQARLYDHAIVKGSVWVSDKVQVGGYRTLLGSEWFYGSAFLTASAPESRGLWAGDFNVSRKRF